MQIRIRTYHNIFNHKKQDILYINSYFRIRWWGSGLVVGFVGLNVTKCHANQGGLRGVIGWILARISRGIVEDENEKICADSVKNYLQNL